MSCCDFGIFPGSLLQWFFSLSYLWPAAPVDVHADGTVGAAAAHEEMSPVVWLNHPDEVPTAVLEKWTQGDKRATWKVEEKHLWSPLEVEFEVRGFTVEVCLTFRLSSFWTLSTLWPHQGLKYGKKIFNSKFEFLSLLFYELYIVFLRRQNVCLGQIHKDVWQREEVDYMNTSFFWQKTKVRLRLAVLQ